MYIIVRKSRKLLLSWFVPQVQLPGYLRSLPLPKNLAGFSELTRAEWLELLPFFLFLIILLYLVFSPFFGVLTRTKQSRPHINRKIKKGEPKVVDTIDIEDIEKEGGTTFCRCWKSKKVRTTNNVVCSKVRCEQGLICGERACNVYRQWNPKKRFLD